MLTDRVFICPLPLSLPPGPVFDTTAVTTSSCVSFERVAEASGPGRQMQAGRQGRRDR